MNEFVSNNETPFKEELVDSRISPTHAGSGKLFELGQNSDKVVRVESFDRLKQIYGDSSDPVHITALVKKLYSELENDFDIKVPVDFVVGVDPKGEKVIYGITDKIEGVDLDKIAVTAELAEKVEAL